MTRALFSLALAWHCLSTGVLAQDKSPGSPAASAASSNSASDSSATIAVPELEPGFVWLFDGQSLEGWEGNQKWFRIEDKSIVAGSLKEKIPNNEFLCSKKRYDNFELRFQVRLKGQGNNAGVQFRSERVPNHHEVSGYQCDVGGAFERSVWGALYDESRRNKMLAEGVAADVKKWTREGQWNDLRVRCEAAHIQIWLNGNPTVDYREEDAKIPQTGIIGLQIHSGPPTEAWYRAIRIRSLSE